MVVKVDVLTYEEVSLFIGGELNVLEEHTRAAACEFLLAE